MFMKSIKLFKSVLIILHWGFFVSSFLLKNHDQAILDSSSKHSTSVYIKQKHANFFGNSRKNGRDL